MDGRSDHHHHHRSSSSDEDDQPPPPFRRPPPRPDFPSYGDQPPPPFHGDRPPPPFYGDQPPPPPFYGDQPPPPPQSFSSYENQPPPYNPPGGYQSSGSHYSHAPEPRVSDEPEEEEERHRYRPHMPGFIESRVHGHSHQSEGGSDSGPGPDLDLSRKPSVKVYCKAETNHMLAIRSGKVILARSDPNDPTQHWVKDEKYSTKVKDQDGYPSFALVNKSTGQALKHSIGATHPVQLIAYNPAVLDESVLWTSGKDLGDEYRQIRMVNNTRLVFDAFNGDKNHGGVHDGTTIVLWEPGKGDNQRWHITPY